MVQEIDFFALAKSGVNLLVIPFFAGMVVLLLVIMRHARQISPFKDKVAELQTACPRCGKTIPFYASYCPVCGVKLESKEQGQLTCGKCGARLENSANYCTACGSRVVKQPWRGKLE